jgi:hypothetical protein
MITMKLELVSGSRGGSQPVDRTLPTCPVLPAYMYIVLYNTAQEM